MRINLKRRQWGGVALIVLGAAFLVAHSPPPWDLVPPAAIIVGLLLALDLRADLGAPAASGRTLLVLFASGLVCFGGSFLWLFAGLPFAQRYGLFVIGGFSALMLLSGVFWVWWLLKFLNVTLQRRRD